MRDQDHRCAIGIDVGGTNLRAALVGQDGSCLQKINERVRGNLDEFRVRIEDIVDILDRTASRPVGIGLPGRVDVRANSPVSAGYLDIVGLQIPTLFGAGGRVVQLDNDASMALRAEMAIGSARGVDDVVMLTIGTGIGGAFALNGRIVRGKAFAGQFGHIAVEASRGEICKCGRRGCIETTSSGSSLGRLIRGAGLPPETTASDLLDRAQGGDAASLATLRAWASPLRSAIDSIIAILDPQLIVLGGGLGRDAVAALRFAPARSGWFEGRIVAAALGDDAGVIGAGLHALQVASERTNSGVPA